MKATVVIGLGFGDEGKGATVDYLSKDADLVVRFSGGAQCGHNVVTPEGVEHVFSQFGSGSLQDKQTYLAPGMIYDPEAAYMEEQALNKKGFYPVITAHPRCLVTTYLHKIWNRADAKYLKHGTCGAGVGKTKEYWLQYGEDAIFVEDLVSPKIDTKLELLQNRISKFVGEEWREELYDEGVVEHLMPRISDEIPYHRHAIYEGNQGVLLDETYGFHPHTTWTTCRAPSLNGYDSVEVLGVTRSYLTRHGEGPMPTYKSWSGREDKRNPYHQFQGVMRFGPLDFSLLRYATAVQEIDRLVINHMDQYDGDVSVGYENTDIQFKKHPTLVHMNNQCEALRRMTPMYRHMTEGELLDQLSKIAPVAIIGRGETRNDRECG